MPGDPVPDPLEELLESFIGRRVILISVVQAVPLEGVLNKETDGLWKHSLTAEGGQPAKDLWVRTAGIMGVAVNKLPGDDEGTENVVNLS